MKDSRKCGGVGGRSFTVSSKYGRCVEVVDVAEVADVAVASPPPAVVHVVVVEVLVVEVVVVRRWDHRHREDVLG